MVYKDLPPLTDADGEARELTDEDFLWFVETADFGSHDAMLSFLMRREELFMAAESAGLERDAFLPLSPSKPGFEDRVEKAFGAVLRKLNHAAE